MKETEVHLTPEQLRQRLKLKEPDENGRGGGIGTLANWRTAGTGPKFIALGKTILYPLSEVEAWEKKRTKRSTAE